jgi:hypothetical protein
VEKHVPLQGTTNDGHLQSWVNCSGNALCTNPFFRRK